MFGNFNGNEQENHKISCDIVGEPPPNEIHVVFSKKTEIEVNEMYSSVVGEREGNGRNGTFVQKRKKINVDSNHFL